MSNEARIEKAFTIANNAIYFDDNSDYKTALYEVCRVLKPMVQQGLIGIEFLKENLK